MEKALQLHTHTETESITHTHTLAARGVKLKEHFLASKRYFPAIISRSME